MATLTQWTAQMKRPHPLKGQAMTLTTRCLKAAGLHLVLDWNVARIASGVGSGAMKGPVSRAGKTKLATEIREFVGTL